jgi:phage-related protein
MIKILILENVEKFIISLKSVEKAKIIRKIELLEEFGKNLSMPHSKNISKNFYELRIKGNLEIRLFYIFKKRNIYIIHGFIKKQNKIPLKEFKKGQRIKNKIELDTI